jgi:hypothetical protein
MDMELLNLRLRERHQDCIDKAKKVDRVIKNTRRRLRKLGFFAQIFNWRRILKIDRRLHDLKWQRFAYVSVALSIARQISWNERRSRV